MKHLYPDGLSVQGLTAWFDDDENDVSHMPWLSQSPHFIPVEHIWETSLSSKHQLRDLFFWKNDVYWDRSKSLLKTERPVGLKPYKPYNDILF